MADEYDSYDEMDDVLPSFSFGNNKNKRKESSSTAQRSRSQSKSRSTRSKTAPKVEAAGGRRRDKIQKVKGTSLIYEVGKEGRRTGVKAKENVKKDLDGQENVEDFFDSSDDEEVDMSLTSGSSSQSSSSSSRTPNVARRSKAFPSKSQNLAKRSKKLSKRPVAEPQTPLPPENEEIFDDLPSPVGALDLDQTESPSPRRKPPPANKNSSSSRGHKRKREASEPKRSEKAERKKAKRPVADSYIAKLADEPAAASGRLPPRRTRGMKPLEFWRNEGVRYGRRASGTFPTVVDVVHVDREEEKPRAKPKRRVAPTKKVKEVSELKEKAVPEKIIVYNATADSDIEYCVAKPNSAISYKPLRLGKAPGFSNVTASPSAWKGGSKGKTQKDIRTGIAFEVGNFGSGTIEMDPRSTTRKMNTNASTEAYYVVEGSVTVTIHKTKLDLVKGIGVVEGQLTL